ncbi:MAG: hypothetical protein M1836_000557 [Candelina mexicana]|nr:MAG: hypothetical protein M1836_000557 [Candelina mexicana]
MGGVDFAEASTKVFDHSTSENNITESGLDIQEVCIATNGTQTVVPASPSATETNTSTLTPLSSVSPRQGSPVLSSNGSSKEASKLVDLATIARNGSPPAKRRKLTVAEKDQRMQEKQEKQKEKQAKEVERAEKKARLDEEKRTKDEKREEARRRKEVEREQKMQAKEKEKRKKDEDRQRKEEVKDKKDKAGRRPT